MQYAYPLLAIFICGMLLLTIGFNFRERSSGIGVLMIWAGMLLILGTVVYKILAKLAE